ncbi:TraR/DksA family transcriptional regulator [Caenispirillum salinarum]|uniref:TraR/DksA family transcriptional regulator n=1 Tax=Caenispirillum salinarum TaxID=859058 RepID=UPI00384F7C99
MTDTPLTDRTDIDADRLRERLRARREELQAMTQSTRLDRAPVELDQQSVGRLSRMDALQGQAMALETERRRGIELARIDAALARMDEGEYGYCVSCGEEIGVKRLDLDPAVPTCIDCAAGGEA